MARTSRRGPWLPEEDSALIELVRTQGPNNWVRISQQLQHRSPKQCRERYHQNLKPSLNHDPISAQEGEKIEQLVEEMGKRWAEIARRLGNRSDNAVKNWWNGSINRRKRSPSSQHTLRHIGDQLHPDSNTVSHGSASEPMEYTPTSARPESLRTSHLFRDPWAAHSAEPSYHRRPAPLNLDRHSDRLAPLSRVSIARYSQSGNDQQPYDQRREGAAEPSRFPPIRLPSISAYHLDSGYVSGLEKSSVSPSVSEFSHAYSSRHVPSLISDSQSTCSISPRFVTSPNTSSAPSTDPATYSSIHHERPQSCGYQGMKGQLPLSPLSIDKFTIPPILSAPEAYKSSYRPASYNGDGRCSSYDHTMSRQAEPLRDRRMHVSSLVQ